MSVHVVPVADLVGHDCSESGDGVCGPTVEPVERLDGSVGFVVVHHALDGRP